MPCRHGDGGATLPKDGKVVVNRDVEIGSVLRVRGCAGSLLSNMFEKGVGCRNHVRD